MSTSDHSKPGHWPWCLEERECKMLTNQLDWLADSRPWGTRKTVAEAVGMQWRIVSSGRETTVPVKLTISKMFAVNACDWALCRTIALSHAMFYKCGAKKIWMKMRRKSALYWDVIWFSVFANPIQFCTPTDSKPNYHFSESMVHFVAESLKVDYIANGKWLRLTSARLHKNLQEKFFRLHTCQNCWFLYKSVIGDTEVTQQWHADSGVCWRAGLRGLCSLVGLQFLPCQDWSRHSWWFWQWLTQIHTAWCLLHWKGSESTSSAPGLLFQLACSI